MITKDRLKEEIGLNKLAITIISAVDFSLISWAWKNNPSGMNWQNIFVGSLIISLTVLLGMFCYITIKKIKELDYV